MGDDAAGGKLSVRPWGVVLVLVLLAAPALLWAQALETTFADLKGEVQYSVAGSTQYQQADSNTVLHTGDRLRTLTNSSARLTFYEGSTTDWPPSPVSALTNSP